MTGKMVGVWFPISMFIAIGFEHSVANMFILPAGIFSGADLASAHLAPERCRTRPGSVRCSTQLG